VEGPEEVVRHGWKRRTSSESRASRASVGSSGYAASASASASSALPPASTSSASCSFPLSSCAAAPRPSSATTMVLTPHGCWQSTLGGRLRRPRRQV
jgi:hypothetical protein